MSSFLFLLAGSIVILASSFLRGERDKLPQVCVAVGFLVFSLLLNLPQALTVILHPRTIDALLYRIDLTLHMDPLILSRIVYSHRMLVRFLVICYDAIPFVAAVAYALERSTILIKTAVIAAVGAFVLYNIFPAVGPAHALQGFPWSDPQFRQVVDNVPRNCMPSMHFGWAVLIAWNARHLTLRIVGWLFVFVMIFATVGLGEHYYIDLIVAGPFCWTIQKSTENWNEV